MDCGQARRKCGTRVNKAVPYTTAQLEEAYFQFFNRKVPTTSKQRGKMGKRAWLCKQMKDQPAFCAFVKDIVPPYRATAASKAELALCRKRDCLQYDKKLFPLRVPDLKKLWLQVGGLPPTPAQIKKARGERAFYCDRLRLGKTAVDRRFCSAIASS